MLTMSRWTLCRVAATTLSAGIVAMAVPAHAGAWVVDAKSDCQVWNPDPQLEELVAWSGSCANGRAEGPGVAQWSKDGSRSETDQGEWRDGRQTGKGTQTWSSGRYEGELSDGEPNGHCILTLQKLHYEGDFRKENPMALARSRPEAKPCEALGKMDVCRVRGRAQSAFPYQPVGDRRCNMVSECAR